MSRSPSTVSEKETSTKGAVTFNSRVAEGPVLQTRVDLLGSDTESNSEMGGRGPGVGQGGKKRPRRSEEVFPNLKGEQGWEGETRRTTVTTDLDRSTGKRETMSRNLHTGRRRTVSLTGGGRK